jgi:uncharacterized protein
MKAAAPGFPVDALELMLTLRCNLACSYCLRHDPKEEMSPDMARRAVALLFAKPAARKDLTFTGGEPLLRLERVKALARQVRARARRAKTRLCLNVLTNGTTLTPAALDFLDAEDVRVVVTLCGEPQTQDRCRRGANGRGSWRQVEKGLDALIARVPPKRLMVTIAVDPASAHRLRTDYRFLVGRGLRNFNICAVFGAPWTARQAADLAREYAAVLADAVASARTGDPVVIQALATSLKRSTGAAHHYDYSDTRGTDCPLSFRLTAWPDGVLSLNPFRFGPRAADHAVGHLRDGFKKPFLGCAPGGPDCASCRKGIVQIDRGYGTAYMAASGVDPEGFRRSWQANVLLCDGAVNRAVADKVWRLSSAQPALKRYMEVNDSWCDLVG